jgi:hypothetical protein
MYKEIEQKRIEKGPQKETLTSLRKSSSSRAGNPHPCKPAMTNSNIMGRKGSWRLSPLLYLAGKEIENLGDD